MAIDARYRERKSSQIGKIRKVRKAPQAIQRESVILICIFNREKKEADAAARRPKKLKVEKNDQEGQLWVDKYRPKTYIELMGDQRLNRNVLRWVKQWDYCVFKKKHQEESQRDKVMRQYKNTFGTDPRFAAYKKPTVEVSALFLQKVKKESN